MENKQYLTINLDFLNNTEQNIYKIKVFNKDQFKKNVYENKKRKYFVYVMKNPKSEPIKDEFSFRMKEFEVIKDTYCLYIKDIIFLITLISKGIKIDKNLYDKLYGQLKINSYKINIPEPIKIYNKIIINRISSKITHKENKDLIKIINENVTVNEISKNIVLNMINDINNYNINNTNNNDEGFYEDN